MGLLQKNPNELLHSHTMEGHRFIIKSPLTVTISSQTVVLGQGVSLGDHLFEVVVTREVWVFADLPIERASRSWKLYPLRSNKFEWSILFSFFSPSIL